MGAQNPAIDAMIAALLTARDRPEFVAAVRALDRVLLSRILRHPAVSFAHAMGGALVPPEAPGENFSVRLTNLILGGTTRISE